PASPRATTWAATSSTSSRSTDAPSSPLNCTPLPDAGAFSAARARDLHARAPALLHTNASLTAGVCSPDKGLQSHPIELQCRYPTVSAPDGKLRLVWRPSADDL